MLHTLLRLKRQRRKVEEKKLRHTLRYELKCINTAQRHLQTEFVEQCYAEQCAHGISDNPSSTSLFLLDEIITPLSESSCSCTPLSDIPTTHFKLQLECARQERDNALLACQNRDMVEKAQEEKQTVKKELEDKLEVVRNVWRNKS